MPIINDMEIQGPNGEAWNVRICPRFDRAAAVRISAYVAPDEQQSFSFQPDAVTYLTGFDFEGPPELFVRQIRVGPRDLLRVPGKLGRMAPLGILELTPIICQVWTVVQVDVGPIRRVSRV